MWKSLVYDCLVEFSDIDYQRRLWRGKLPGLVGSFDELICNFYDDADAERFVSLLYENGESALAARIDDFRRSLDCFLSRNPDAGNEIDIFDNEEWLAVSLAAKQLLPLFHKKPGGNG